MDTPTILLVAAASLEIEPLLVDAQRIEENFYTINVNKILIDVLITGLGSTAMTYYLTKQLQNRKYSFVVLLGVAGAYSHQFQLGDVVFVKSERFADLGILEDNKFTSLFDMQLCEDDTFPFINGKLDNYTLINNKIIEQLPVVKGNTVQSIRPSINSAICSNTDIESMEGASFFYVCMLEKQAFVQLRAISNYVGEQNKKHWNIPLAVTKLTNTFKDVINEFTVTD